MKNLNIILSRTVLIGLMALLMACVDKKKEDNNDSEIQHDQEMHDEDMNHDDEMMDDGVNPDEMNQDDEMKNGSTSKNEDM